MTRVHRPGSLEEAAALLASLGPGARVLAGGTDAFARLADGRAPPAHWVDLSRVGGAARAIEVGDERLVLGSLVSFEELARSEAVGVHLAALRHAASIMGSIQIRGRGTLGGNLCNASPAGDAIPSLVAAGAMLRLLSRDGARDLPIGDFFLGPGRTALAPGEILSAVSVQRVPGRRSAFLRLGPRAHHVISVASGALCCQVEDGRLRGVRLALGAVAPTVIRALAAEALLEGQLPEPARLAAAGRAAADATSPIGDVRSSAWYRREVCEALPAMLFERLA